MRNNRANGFKRFLGELGMSAIIRFRFFWLIGILLLVAYSGFGLQKIRLDSFNESFLPETDALYAENERFKEIFGNEEFVFILVESENIISHEVMTAIRDLQVDLENSLPFVREATAITNVEYMDTVGDDLVISDLLEDQAPSAESAYEEIKRKLSSSKMYMNRIVTSDWRHAGIAITFERIPTSVWVLNERPFIPIDELDWPDDKVIMADRIYYDRNEAEALGKTVRIDDARKLIAPALKVIMRRHEGPAYKLKATGIPVMDFEADRTITAEGQKLGFIALMAAMALMIILFKNLSGVLAPLVVILFTLAVLFGNMGWMGIPLSMASMIVAPLLVVISVSYSIHFINHFNFHFRRNGDRQEALRYAYAQAIWPCFLTAMTTSVGFASFLIVSMKPVRDVGATCGIGVIIAYFLVMIIVPVGYSFGRKDMKIKKSGIMDEGVGGSFGMSALANWVASHKVIIITFFSSVMVASSFYLQRIKVEFDFIGVIGDKLPYIKEALSISDTLGGHYSYEVLVELPEKGMAKEPDVLKSLDATAQFAAKRQINHVVK